jgi:simple sugar transport system ATP-binding protein
VGLAVDWGQVHALLGENGAGKSTLMNVVYGLIKPDEGEIVFDGRPVQIHGPQDAIKLGIGMVHQHFMLIPPLTVAENIVLGHEISNRGVMDLDRAGRTVEELSKRYGLEVNPRERIADLSVGLQQRVEILKALYRGARLLILDEPTAVLTPQEINGLFEIVRTLVAEGNAVIFITHKLAEVMEIADQITVMRRGRVVATTTPKESSPADLARMMVGRPVLLSVDKKPAQPGAIAMSIEDLVVLDDRRHVAVDRVSLDISHATTRTRLHDGLGLIPPDRHRMGVILELSVADNLVLDDYDRPPFARWMVRQFKAIAEYGARLIKTFDIRVQSPDQPVSSLSGGNQQKLVVARQLGTLPKVLIASQPTRGVDVGSIEFIHRQIVSDRDRGLAVLLISSELDEVLSLADRVAVLYRGRVAAVIDANEADRERVGLLMAGAA